MSIPAASTLDSSELSRDGCCALMLTYSSSGDMTDSRTGTVTIGPRLTSLYESGLLGHSSDMVSISLSFAPVGGLLSFGAKILR